MTLTEAEKLASEASKVRRHIEQQIEDAKQAISDEYRKLIEAEHETVDNAHAAILQDAIEQEREANRLRDELKVASMKDATLGGVPVGGRVCKWGRHWRTDPMKKSGDVGIVEVCTKDSKFPSNVSYGLPSIGDLFVRVLKKDGTPSLRYDGGRFTVNDNMLPYGWYPEGVEPK